MGIYTSLWELVGKTPMLQAKNLEKSQNLTCRLLLKLEGFNPGGSIKDRAALSMIQAAGLGVAMENAMEILKQQADYITGSNQEDGVASAIEHFILSAARQ